MRSLRTVVVGFLPLALAAPFESSSQLRWIGRVNPSTRQLTWPGSGLTFSFTGTSASIAVTEVDGAVSADLFIDDATPLVLSNIAVGNISTPGNLTSGTHTVTLRTRSETAYGTWNIGNITTSGRFHAAPAAPSRQIEIIGDSITVGYGADGTYPCANTAALEDNPKTYAALAASNLSADYHVIAWSGKGLTRNYVTSAPDTSPLMPELWTRYGANDADNSYTFPASWNPQAVVINLGTNDFSELLSYANGTSYQARPSLNATTFTNAMVNFVQTIQKRYTRAHFFLMTSPLLSDGYPTAAEAQWTTLKNATLATIARVGSDVASYVEWQPQGSAVGCDYHPNLATHAAEAPILASAIAKVLGW